MGTKTQVVHQGQHPYKHKAQEILYSKAGVGSNVKVSLDELYTMVSGAVNWKDPVATYDLLPITGNSINDARIVQDDGMTFPAMYVCVGTTGPRATQWLKIADVSWGTLFDGTVADGDLVKKLGNVLTKVTAIPESLIVESQAISSFTNDAGTQELGATLNSFNLNWAFNRDSANPTSQNITPIVGASWTNPITVALRTIAVASAGLTSSQTFTFAGVGDDSTVLAGSTTVSFQAKRYWGISNAVIASGADVMSILEPQNDQFGTSRATTKTFDASAGTPPNYLYIVYPQSWGSPASTKFGGFTFSDYTETVVSLTNASGYTSNYIILKTNNNYNGAGLEWQIL